MQVKNGVDVDPGWDKVIAYSTDGVKWDTLHKDNISNVNHVYMENYKDISEATRGYLFQDLARIFIHTTDGRRFDFEVQGVTNQPTWITTPASAGLDAAIADINNWI